MAVHTHPAGVLPEPSPSSTLFTNWAPRRETRDKTEACEAGPWPPSITPSVPRTLLLSRLLSPSPRGRPHSHPGGKLENAAPTPALLEEPRTNRNPQSRHPDTKSLFPGQKWHQPWCSMPVPNATGAKDTCGKVLILGLRSVSMSEDSTRSSQVRGSGLHCPQGS